MHIITTKTHGLLDYLFAVLLFVSPWVLDFATGGIKVGIPVIFGVGIPIFSLFTQYEGGLIRVIPMRAHIFLDLLFGIFIAASPWLFHFDEIVYGPHLGFGIFLILLALFSDNKPYDYQDPRRALP